MDLIADILLLCAALGAGLYCFVLARRLRRFTDLEAGMGGAVAVLSVQVEDMKKALENARQTSDAQVGQLEAATSRAEDALRRLELTMATTHDLPAQAGPGAGRSDGRSVRRRRRGPEDDAGDGVAA